MHTKFFSGINFPRVSKELFLLAAAIVVFLFPSAIFGQTQIDDNWMTLGSGSWSNSANWSSGVPNNNSSTLYNVLIDTGTSTTTTIVSLDISPTINNLTVDSNNVLQVGSGTQSLTIAGSTINNSGSILAGSGATLQLVIDDGSVTLSGGGTLTLSSTSSISASTTGDTLVNESTIQGGGTIGNGLVLNNSGLIIATISSPLTINVTNTLTNTGLLESTGVATLKINGGVIQNAGGTIQAVADTPNGNTNVIINGSTIDGGTISGSSLLPVHASNGIVQLDGVTINGSTIETDGPATILFSGTDVINDGSFVQGGSVKQTMQCFGGSLSVNGGSNSTTLEDCQLTLAGGFTNNGTLTKDTIVIGGMTTLSSGSIISSSTISASTSGETLTNPGLIMSSKIGDNGLVVVNSETIDGTTTLNVQNVTDTNSGTIAGTMIGTGTAIIDNSGGLLDNAVIEDLTVDGGTIAGKGTLSSSTLDGATFKTGGTYKSNGANTIDGGSSAATLQISNGSSLTLGGGFTNTGKVQLLSSGTATQLLISGNETLAGTISLSNNANNVIQGASTGNEVLTNKGTLEGSGNIGNGFMGLVNTGTILANQSTALTIDPSSAGFSNSGKLTVNSGSTLNITGPANSFTDTGTVKVLSGGTLAMGSNLNFTQTKGTTTVDGTLSVTSANSIDILAGTLFGNNGTLDGNFILNATGVLNPGDGSKKIGDLTIDGTYTQEGTKSSLTIDLGGTTADTGYSVLNITNAASLGGKLVIDLVNGFTPVAGDTFDILDYSSETGTFSATTLPKLTGGDTWSISYNSTGVVLTVDGPGAGPASAATSVHNNVASTVRHAVAGHGAAIAGDDMRAPSAILARAETCGGFRTFASFACMREAVSGIASGFTHTVASHGTMASTLHNNVASVSRVHSNVAVAQGVASSSHEPTVSATSVARFYVCAYMPDELARTMGCR